MKTIELTIPTSLRELGIKETVLSIYNRVITSINNSFEYLQSMAVASKEKSVYAFSSLNKISFGKAERMSNSFSTSRESRGNKFSSIKSWRPSRKHIKFGVYAIALVLLVGITRSVLQGSVKSDSTDRTEIADPDSTTIIDRTYQFPFYDESGEAISDFEYTIEKAELRDEVLIQGRPARAINGKTFFVVYIKIKNDYKGSLQLNAAEYVRLVVDGNEDELLAPEMNSDPVQIQAISTKSTRIGFPIDDGSVNDLKLQVGEIDGDKDIIEVDF